MLSLFLTLALSSGSPLPPPSPHGNELLRGWESSASRSVAGRPAPAGQAGKPGARLRQARSPRSKAEADGGKGSWHGPRPTVRLQPRGAGKAAPGGKLGRRLRGPAGARGPRTAQRAGGAARGKAKAKAKRQAGGKGKGQRATIGAPLPPGTRIATPQEVEAIRRQLGLVPAGPLGPQPGAAPAPLGKGKARAKGKGRGKGKAKIGFGFGPRGKAGPGKRAGGKRGKGKRAKGGGRKKGKSPFKVSGKFGRKKHNKIKGKRRGPR